jgi:hypothetical protein
VRGGEEGGEVESTIRNNIIRNVSTNERILAFSWFIIAWNFLHLGQQVLGRAEALVHQAQPVLIID